MQSRLHEADASPGDTPVPEVGKRMKCSKCGSRKLDVRPELYPGGVVADAASVPREPGHKLIR